MQYQLDEKTSYMLYDVVQHLAVLKGFYKRSNDPVGATMVAELIYNLQVTFEVE